MSIAQHFIHKTVYPLIVVYEQIGSLIIHHLKKQQMRKPVKNSQFASILCSILSIIPTKIIHVQLINCRLWLAGTTEAAPPSLASFNDSRCADTSMCVDSTDPLLFTCNLTNVVGLQVTFPNGEQEIVTVGSMTNDLKLPVGFKAVSFNASEIDKNKRNFSLTLSIANASLLDGRGIICDDLTPKNILSAGCRVCGKF